MSVWFVIPSGRPEAETADCLAAWKRQGYKIALWLDPSRVAPAVADLVIIGEYPGYHVAVNSLCRKVMEQDPDAEWMVTGGDDTFPDPNVCAEEIAAQCTGHFSGTFGAMQPIGDSWLSPTNFCGSPFMGREFCRRMYGGKGPFCELYFAQWGDVELYDVCSLLGIIWQRPDLTHYHHHWLRLGGSDPHCPEFLWKSVAYIEGHRDLFNYRREHGYPGHEPLRMIYPEKEFHTPGYLGHNIARLSHLESLGISLAGKTVLELGAGIGDHTQWLLDQGAIVTAVEARDENIVVFKQRFPSSPILQMNLETPGNMGVVHFDVVLCYGTLYHLNDPKRMLEWAAMLCETILIETCVSWGIQLQLNSAVEGVDNATESISGTGCRPTRPWLWSELQKLFPFVYSTVTQPNHSDFPVDWRRPSCELLSRAIFVASHIPLLNPKLMASLPVLQERHV